MGSAVGRCGVRVRIVLPEPQSLHLNVGMVMPAASTYPTQVRRWHQMRSRCRKPLQTIECCTTLSLSSWSLTSVSR